MNNTIKIKRKILTSRDLIRDYQKEINAIKNDTVILDFSAVEFISRSATHEFLKLKEEYKIKNNKYLIFKKTSEDISKMFEIVAQSMAIKKEPVSNIKMENIFV